MAPMEAERHSDLGRGLKAVLQVLPVRVVSEECEAGQLRLSDADPLVQSVEEFLHCGGTIETYNLWAGKKKKTEEKLIKLGLG